MRSAINAPQSKSVTIAFMALKMTIFILIVSNTAKTLSNNQQQFKDEETSPCASPMLTFASIVKIFYLLACVLDSFSLLYFFCVSDFKCMEFYVFFGYHIILTIVSVVGAITTRSDHTCSFERTYLGAIFSAAVIFLFSSLIVMWSNLYFSLKFAHFGSNIVWFIIWILGRSCDGILVTLVAAIHGFLSVSGFLLFVINKIMKKTTFTAKIWKAFACISLFLMIFCYILILFDLMGDSLCEQDEFFKKNYQVFGLIEISSPILILIFLKNEDGDPRQKMIKNHEQVFRRLNQNENIDLAQKE